MPTAMLSEHLPWDADLGPHQAAPGVAEVPATPAGGHRRRIASGARPADALLPLALVLWLTGVHALDPAGMNDFGLLSALPVVFFVGLGLLVCSTCRLLVQRRLSPVRLGLHLVALVLVLHGTVPLVFTEPHYPWVYKHVGVVGYINLHGSVDASVDIYHNWPGFFALAAWFDRLAGVGSPLTYAAWAPVYFNLLICLELAFVVRSLPVSRRVGWLALFLFVAGNWVGQDYFAPQAMAFVLSLAVFGIVLAWFQVERPSEALTPIRRRIGVTGRSYESSQDADREPAPPPPPVRPRTSAMVVLFATFAVLVVTHQLSPYVVILGVGLLTLAGRVRPRWLVVGLLAVAGGYLLLHLAYVDDTQDLFGSMGNPLRNIYNTAPSDSVPMFGRRVTALAAPALIAGIWSLGMLGILRRVWDRRSALVLALLAAAPGLVALGQSYGGEAIFRIYLFSLPWTAVLAASALDPRPRRWPLWPVAKVAMLAVMVALFVVTSFGAEELYLVRPGEVAASQYFYDHAEPGSVLTLGAPNFPTRVSARYDQIRAGGDNLPNLLTTVKRFRLRMLGPNDLPAVADFVDNYVDGGAGGRYLVISAGHEVYARVLGLLPPGSMASLDRALAASPDWSVFYRSPDAVIYKSRGGQSAPATPPAAPAEPARSHEQSWDWVGISVGLLGMGLLVPLWRRRRAADFVKLTLDKEKSMRTSAPPNGLDARPGLSEASEPSPLAVPEPLHPTVPSGDAGQTGSPMSPTHIRPLLDDPSGAVRAAAASFLDQSPESVAELRRLLRDDLSATVRAAATEALAGAPDGDQLWALSVALGDPEAHVRIRAIEALPVAGTVRAAPSVRAAGEDDDERVRYAAYLRLAASTPGLLWMAVEQCSHVEELCVVLRTQDPQDSFIAVVRERMSSAEPHDRTLALDVACRLEMPGWIDGCVDALQDPDASVRGAAVTRLGGRPEGLAALVATLRDDPDATVRTGAAGALAGMAVDALPAFVGALQDPEVNVRRIAIETLVRHRSPGLARRVAHGLNPANTGAVGQVLLGMGDIGEDALVAAAVDGPRDRASAATALLENTGTVGRLLAGLGVVDPASRLRTVEALGALGGAEAVAGLATALSDARPGIRSRAAYHLGQIADACGREPLQRLSESDQVPEVLWLAGEALHLIDEHAR